MSRILNYRASTVHSSSAVFIGYLFIIIGIAYPLFFGTYGALIFVLIGVFLTFSFYGVLFNRDQNTFKQYASYFGIKTGDWKKLESMPDIALLQSNESTTTYSSSLMSYDKKDHFFKVFLLSKNHRIKILVKKTHDRDAAKEVIEELKELFDLNYVKYDPIKIKKQNRRK
jgi:hypothetical protein